VKKEGESQKNKTTLKSVGEIRRDINQHTGWTVLRRSCFKKGASAPDHHVGEGGFQLKQVVEGGGMGTKRNSRSRENFRTWGLDVGGGGSTAGQMQVGFR